MNREQILAAADAIVARAESENRAMTAEEQSEFDRLIEQHGAAGANADRRASLAALRQASGVTERIERVALAPNQAVASLYPTPQGDTRRVADIVCAQLGMLGPNAGQSMQSGAAGGWTVPEHLSAQLIDRARAQSQLISAGMRTVPIRGSERFATVESDPEIRSHAENASIDESEVVFGSRLFVPTTKVCLIRASVELVEDSANFADMVDSVLARAFAAEIDRLGLHGTGVGESLGVLNTPDVVEIDGSTFDSWSPFARAVQAVRSANYTPGDFVLSPGALGAIDDLVDGEDNPLRRPPSLEGARFLPTTNIADGATTTAITGQWDNLFFATRTGLTIESTRTGGDAFNKLSVLIRAYLRAESFIVRRSAFAKVVNIPVPAIA